EGTFQGRRAGARIDVDPANPAAPNGWCLRRYGFLGVSFPALETYTLEHGRPLVLKYRVTVFSTQSPK
ncbi:MAG: PmoA family protein, partial [Acidobacteria bacterium]|nr:PmoA family protein [Acidobacteriota bacterium]